MAQLSPFAMIHTLDQWRRSAHVNTALEKAEDNLGVVQLQWLMDERIDLDADNDNDDEIDTEAVSFAGMAFDPWCRLYRARPESGQIDRLLWAAGRKTANEAVPLFSPAAQELGDFNASDDASMSSEPLVEPVDVVIDKQGRLFIAERGQRRILIFDLIENQLLRNVNFKHTPTRLATDGDRVWVVLRDSIDPDSPKQIAVMDARREPTLLQLPDNINHADVVAVNQSRVYVIDRAGSEDARIISLDDPDDSFGLPYASDMVFVEENILVVARRSQEDFLRLTIEPGAQTELPHLKARHYDGRGIVVTPDGHVAYWSSKGLLRATLARVRYQTSGTITSFQLDCGEFQTQWGRLFIDACLPRGTSITARCLVLDEIPETTQPIDRTAPENVIGMTIQRPDLSPPMPPEVLLDNVATQQAFHRRENGREIPWQAEDDNHFRTYEAPIIAPPGRFLWVELQLSGTARLTPRIKSLRAEYPSHDLLRRLPQVYSRELSVADFLRRYLAMPEGMLRDLDLQASFRHILLDPYATPAELLPWLGGFIGLVIDKRWSEQSKRELVANGTWLFRYRGTVIGLKRFLEIYLGFAVTIIEHFKVRGIGGALIGESDALTSNSVLGSGFRIGGKLGQEENESINEVSIEDAITSHAHRFSIIIPASLSSEQQSVVQHLLDTHRPAHTLYDICSVDAGMRIGLGLHTGLTSIVGSTSGFGQLQVGGSLLGRTDTIGVAKAGTHIGSSKVGSDSHVG